MNKTTIIMILIWNIFVFFTYYIDKEAAIHDRRRVPERTLIIFALVFGSVGAYLGMKIFHHKTEHSKFMVLVPIFFIIQLVVIYCIIRTEGII